MRPPGTSRCSSSWSAAATSRRPTTPSPTARWSTTTTHIAGMLCVVKEDTEQVIATRRMATLRDLGTRISDLDEAETHRVGVRAPGGQPVVAAVHAHLPLRRRRHARRCGPERPASRGQHPAAPSVLAVDDSDPAWPAAAARAGETVLVRGVCERFADLPHGAWQDPPRDALVVPLAPAGAARRRTASSWSALNPYRPARRGLPVVRPADRRPPRRRRSPTPAPTSSSSERAETPGPRSTRRRPTSSPTSATSSAPR